MPWQRRFEAVPFEDRRDAGRQLAKRLSEYRDLAPVVLALPRGGVLVAVEVSKELNCPFDLVVTRKIGHPFHPEYGIGAVSEDGFIIFNETERRLVDANWLAKEVELQREEAVRRRIAYMDGRPPLDLTGKIAILIDDGIATGFTLRAAIHSVRARRPARLVVAVPVAPPGVVEEMAEEADEFIAFHTPDHLGSVGMAYRRFGQVSDDEVKATIPQQP